MNIKDKVQELSNYFTSKLINGDYEILSFGKEAAEILINEFKFNVWICHSSPEMYFDFYYQLGAPIEFHITDKEDRIKGYENLMQKIKPLEDAERQKEVDKLKARIKELQNK